MTLSTHNAVYVDEAGLLFVKFTGKNWIKITVSGSTATKHTEVVPTGELHRVHIDTSGHIYKALQGRHISIGTTHVPAAHMYHWHCSELLAMTKYIAGQYLTAAYVA